MKFVDRKKEINKLSNFLDSSDTTLAVVYGRRRIGKSTIIKKAIQNRKAVYFQADETQTSNQLALLAKSVSVLIPGFEKVIYPDWYSFLETLNQRMPSESVLVLDEFPYLVKSCDALPSIFQNFFDNTNLTFKIILCGSSQQTMYSEFFNESSPLYGRSDLLMKVKPIKLGYISEAMNLASSTEAIEYYSVWGGVPRYWKLCMAYEDFRDSFSSLLLEHESSLADEANRLLRDDMNNLTLSRTLLSIVGDGANRLSEIAGRIGKPTQELTGPIKKLLDMGYIEKDVPFGENPKKTKKTLYKIKDNFLRAYYKFVAPNASLISVDKPEVVWNIIQIQFSHFMGNSWEDLCRDAISGNVIDGVLYDVVQRWWAVIPNKEAKKNEEIEVDVVASSLDGNHILIGECKWTNSEDGVRVLRELKNKAAKMPFLNDYEYVHYVLFLKEEPLIQPACKYFLPEDIVNILK